MQLINNTSSSHLSVLKTIMSRVDEMLLASPFCYTDFSEFADMIACADTIRKVRFITTLKKNEVISKIDTLLSFCKEMVRVGLNWKLNIDNRLHGKVYIFKRDGVPFAGVITSANLTHKGMEMNHEWGVQIDDVDTLKDLECGILKDVEYSLNDKQLAEIADRVNTKYPNGIQHEKPDEVDIDDIVYAYHVAEGTRIFVKPVGSSDYKIYNGDYS